MRGSGQLHKCGLALGFPCRLYVRYLRCRLFLLLPCPTERLWYGPLPDVLMNCTQTFKKMLTEARRRRRVIDGSHLREVDTERIHVETIHEAGEALTETGQALMHELKMHHVGLEVGHGVRQLSKGGLEGIERE